MNPLLPSPIFALHRSAVLSNDVEMLQTDVMRFFGIMCLCLMAIFALVKALPLAPPADRPTIAEPVDLNAAAASLKKQIAALKEKLAEAQSQLNMATAAAKQSSTQAARAAKSEKKVVARLLNARQELEKISHALQQTRGEITERELKLTKILKDIHDKRRVRAELNTQIQNETRKLKEQHAAVDRAKEKLDRSHHQQPEPQKNRPKSPPTPTPVKKGFTLRFASDAALETLISRGNINFYALAARKAWQLRLSAGNPAFMPAKLPRKIYEMETATVPDDYVTVFHRRVAVFGRHTLTWGVTLPPPMSASINHLIKDREGGDLVIMPDGEVILN